MKSEAPIQEVETSRPAETLSPSTDSLSQVFDDVRKDAQEGAARYLKDTIVSKGGE